jgi:hypothetical protein
VARFNESALASVLADVKFVETEIKRLEKPDLDHVFDEVRLVSITLPWCAGPVADSRVDNQHHPQRRRLGIHGIVHSTNIVCRGETDETRSDSGQAGQGGGGDGRTGRSG